MAKCKQTKKALLSSVIALILCCSMLIGTTFAWFTDSVESGNNIIKSGNLDIELEYWNGTKWVDVSGKSDILTNTLWEPGVTEVAYLRVANAGSLALKYQLGINIISEIAGVNAAGEVFKLSDYIQFGVVEGVNGKTGAYASREAAVAAVTEAKKISAGYTKSSKLYPANNIPDDVVGAASELYLALVVYMPTSVGNEANYKTGTTAPQIDLGINILATQVEAESDSFGKDYDNGAYIPVAPEAVPEAGESLVLNGSDESNVTINVPATVIAGLDDDVTSLSVNASAPVVDTVNKTVSFSTVELVDQDGNEVDIADTGAKVTVTLPVGGAFANGERVEVYHDGSFVTYATVADGKISYEVSHFCEVEVKSAEEVVLDNTIDSVKEFIAFAAAVNDGNTYAGQTVVLGADLDLAGVTWTPIGTSSAPFKGTFDGKGKVIKNLSVLMAGKSNVGLFGYTTDGEIKNVTVENAKVAGRLNVGVIAGTPYTTKYTNIVVKGLVEVDGMAYVGAVGGMNAYADWNNITVNVDATSYVNANSVENGTAYRTYVGGVVGFNGEGGHSLTNITSNINVIGSTCDVGGAFGIAHYGNKFENVKVTGTVTCTNATTEIGGIAGVWHNGGANVVFTNCTYEGELPIVGSAYSTTGNGLLVVDGVEYVGSVAALKAQLAAGKTTINFACDIVGDVTITQAPDVKISIDGNGHKFSGVITVDGKSATYTTAGLTIKNIFFKAESISADACINLGKSGDNNTRYTCNVTVDGCTFDVPGAVGVKSYTGGDKNLTITGCTATANAHSLVQAKGIEGVLVEKCEVYSKNGLNFNNSTNVTVDGCTVDVSGYAVRFGESSGGTGAAEKYAIKNSSLKSANDDGDAVIILRGTADNSTLIVTNTNLVGDLKLKNTAANAAVIIDGFQQVNKPITVAPAPLKEDFLFPAGTNMVLYKDMNLTGDAQIVHTENVGLGLSNVIAELDHDVIVRKSDGAIVIENSNFTLTNGAKLISVGEGGDAYQVFMVNVTINGVKMDNTTIWDYVEGVSYISIVAEWPNA